MEREGRDGKPGNGGREGRLDLNICPGDSEFLVTPLFVIL